MDLFDEVKFLFYISEEAYKIFVKLKYCSLYGGDSILIVCKDKSRKKMVKNALKEMNTKGKICIKTIEQCKDTMDGYRFKKIVFI